MENHMRDSLRLRYFVLASVLYIAIGVIIVARSVTAGVVPLAVLGVVFIALGAIRLRDNFRRPGIGAP
jgi:uncharacterized membrane protein HdeD (DUF308 family)